LGNRQAG